MHLTVARVTRRGDTYTYRTSTAETGRPFRDGFGGKVERMEECKGRRGTYTDRRTDMVDGIGRLEAVGCDGRLMTGVQCPRLLWRAHDWCAVSTVVVACS